MADEKTPDGTGEAIIKQIEEKEEQCILPNTKDGAYAVALAIEGRVLTSEELANRIQRLGVDEIGRIMFVIGGSLGSSGDVMKWVDCALSFSKMTLPHQLTRVVLLEQVYRSYRAIPGEPYHK